MIDRKKRNSPASMTIVVEQSEQEIDIRTWVTMYVRAVIARDAAETKALCNSFDEEARERFEREVKERVEE